MKTGLGAALRQKHTITHFSSDSSIHYHSLLTLMHIPSGLLYLKAQKFKVLKCSSNSINAPLKDYSYKSRLFLFFSNVST